MAAASISRVVIAGPAGAGKKTVSAGITLLASGAESPKPAFTRDGHHVQPLTLRTKYYTAELEILSLPSSEFAAPSDATREHVRAAEALILVCDAAAVRGHNPCRCERALAMHAVGRFVMQDVESTRDPLAAWAALTEEASPATMLLVSNRLDIVTGTVPGAADGRDVDGVGESKADDAEEPPVCAFVSHAAGWCLDNGFEHVECCATAPRANEAARDKVGIARIVEALQSTMWPNMQRLPAEPTATSARPPATSSDAASKAVGTTAERVDMSTGNAAATALTAPVLDSTDDSAAAAVRGTDPSTFNAEDEDMSAGDMDIGRIMEEMQRVRDAARAGGQTDEERREAAARMAMKLFELLGGQDDDGDDGTE